MMKKNIRDPETLQPTEFFNAFWTELENQGWPSVVLHTWELLPERIDSDVDYLLGKAGQAELISFLEGFCDRHGWILAQVMEHEPDAFYCVCFMRTSPWTSLKLDVAWDYQRKGRILLPGSFLLAHRYPPPGKSFYVPTSAAEFAYVLAKGMAKSKDPDQIIARLETLWESDSRNCAEALDTWFGISCDSSGPTFPSARIKAALHPANPAFKKWRSRQWSTKSFLWLMRRLKRPYGMTVVVSPNIDRKGLAEALLPAFRRYHLPVTAPTRWQRLKLEYRSGMIVFPANKELRVPAGSLDLRQHATVDLCVMAALEKMASNGSRNQI